MGLWGSATPCSLASERVSECMEIFLPSWLPPSLGAPILKSSVFFFFYVFIFVLPHSRRLTCLFGGLGPFCCHMKLLCRSCSVSWWVPLCICIGRQAISLSYTPPSYSASPLFLSFGCLFYKKTLYIFLVWLIFIDHLIYSVLSSIKCSGNTKAKRANYLPLRFQSSMGDTNIV